jgi:hypothetical protein
MKPAFDAFGFCIMELHRAEVVWVESPNPGQNAALAWVKQVPGMYVIAPTHGAAVAALTDALAQWQWTVDAPSCVRA